MSEWLSKEWFKILTLLLGAIFFIYWKFFDRNNDVFDLHIENLKDDIIDLKDSIKQNTANISNLTSTMGDMIKHWDAMSQEYRKERKELEKRNQLSERKNDILESELKSKDVMIKYQKEEFKAVVKDISENAYKVLIEHTNYESKTG